MNQALNEQRVENWGGYQAVRAVEKKISINKVLARVEQMSTLPHVAIRLMQMGRDQTTSAAELEQMVGGDPALSAKVLRCVNSAAYGLRFRIGGLRQAIAYMGFNAVRGLAIAVHVADVFRKEFSRGAYSRAGLWRHLLAVGVCARMIAARTGVRQLEETFLAGLLHDIGIILEDQYCHEHFIKVLDALPEHRRLVDAERAILGFDHGELGYQVGDQWKFPHEALDAMAYHHSFAIYTGAHVPVVACVHVANLICSLRGRPSIAPHLIEGEPKALAALHFQPEDVAVVANDLEEELTRHQLLFEL